ncbi:WD repeat-containing protein 55 isoform X2 [Conger conger]|uniref:WD repeat-containing protein 55 isoform X2 n=1 Tax=Conger conger TaxID=82655 RepID=UPI002A5AB15E|nr:WD repeat-containing protein 55 isoform X2 [Conger conger]XP_061104531.1 WD repeat-containing protein 55 isoform X2 [Conger conger]
MAASMEVGVSAFSNETDSTGKESSDTKEEDDATEEPEEPKEPRVRETPEDIRFEAIVNTLAFHPTRDILAAGDIDGDIYVYSYSCTEGETQELWSSGHHLKSCRELAFSQDGQKLFSVSKDKSIHIMDVEAGKLVSRITKAHSVPINALLLIDENLLATGDDGGTLKVWDMRKGTAFMDLKHHEDYISGLAIDQAKKILLTSSGDGMLGVFNIKRRRFDLLSEFQSGDLTSVAIMKHGRKVVCGSSEGTIYIFNWNGFGATSDRFAVRAESVDCIVPITENLLCAASMDGVIRAVNLLPNRVLGSVGQHVGEPVEQIGRSRDSRFLASCAHDQLVKFWDISSLADMEVSDYRRRKKKGRSLKALSKKAFGTGDDFFSGLAEDTQGGKEGKEEEEGCDSGDDDSDSGSD